MKKIPTIFERDWTGDRSRVVNQINPKAQWVFDGEGWPTRKIDGTACMVDGGKFFKRREVCKGGAMPADFIIAEHDDETGKTAGWVPVTDAAEDWRHMEAFASHDGADGTYELVGPKVQGNPEGYDKHTLVNHMAGSLVINEDEDVRNFDGLRKFFASHDMEGIVFHHIDGRMAKIKARDFGIKRAPTGKRVRVEEI